AQRQFTLSAARHIDQKWRAAKGLPENPNAFGPLTNLPDYTYLDGRTTPLGVSICCWIKYTIFFYYKPLQSNQKKRLLKQQEIATKIVELSSELEFAKKRHAQLKAKAQAERDRVMKNKLKPKGPLLLKK
ncbi:mRpL52, partial [Drosophila busckii]